MRTAQRYLWLLATFLLVARPTSAQPVQVGAKAPDFSLRFATRDSIAASPLSLSGMIGRGNIILAFYPADWSGGCTREVCTLRDNFAALSGLKAIILGISGDYVYSHHEWAKHHDLPFQLLSDHDHTVAKQYLSYNETTGYNRRTLYVIDRQGAIAYADMEYSVRDSVDFERLKTALAALP